MNRLIGLIILTVCLFMFVGCAAEDSNGLASIDGTPQEYFVVYHQPENEITDAPKTLLADWDIKSIRDPYMDTSHDEESDDYSMPVFRFDTYDEFLHLKTIIGTDVIPTKDPIVDEDWHRVEYFDYKGGTFDKYTLLLGWFTVESYHSDECYRNNLDYEIHENKLKVFVCCSDDCDCSPDGEISTISGMVWIAVPRADLEMCEGISFFLVDCLPPEE